MILQEKIWLDKESKIAVHDGDKRARFLLGVKGQTISKKIAELYNIVDGKIQVEEKFAKQPENKSFEQPENKKKGK
jgi:hypothetical protein